MRLLIFFFIVYICKEGSGMTYKCNATASCGCSISSTVLTRIIGGENSVQGSWSWAVSLRYYGSHICGGSILSPYFIITAAHCADFIITLTNISILAGTVNLGSSSSSQSSQTRSIAQIYAHPGYDASTQINDIALLRLSTALDMTKGNIKSICLPTGTVAQPPENISMIAVGWGVNSTSSDTVSSILQQVTVQSIADTATDCQSLVYDSRAQFCAGLPNGGKDTCQGDSGGPLMAFVNGLWQLQGLTSYGYECALAGYPGVYTRVSYYTSWIKSITDSNEIKTTTTTKKSSTSTITKKLTTTITARKPTTTTTTTTTKKSSTSTITKKLTTTITARKPTTTTTTKRPVTTTTYKKTSVRKSFLNTLSEMTSNEADYSTQKSLLAEPLLQSSNSAKHSTVQSLFVISFLPIITSAYSFLLLLLL